ncbi:MAG: hypothetical protein N2Z21_08425 [Candidatus Sumerlaeaceae bacterium]|nr:hypothetical protein [Candidatus Sumerlaeaceae bacterium]
MKRVCVWLLRVFLLLSFLFNSPCGATVLVRVRQTTTTVVAVPTDNYPLTTGILIMHNDSPNEVVTIRVSTPLTPDLSNYDRILEVVRERAAEQTTVSLARSAYEIICNYRPLHWVSAKASGEVYDPVKLLNVYGYSLCDAAARALATILHGLGIPAEVWDLRAHVITDFHDGKQWQSLDPDMRVHLYAQDSSRTLPARYYWKFRHLLQPAEVSDNEQACQLRDQLVKALDRVTSPPERAWWKPIASHDAAIRLRPGEMVVRYSSSHLGYFATISPEPPPLYANAIFRWERTLPPAAPTEDDIDETNIRSRFPFVIVGGMISVTSCEAGTPLPHPWVTTAGSDYEPCALVERTEDVFESRAVYELPDSVRGKYEFVVRLCTEDPFICDNLPRVRYEQVVVTQCSPSTFPAVGGNEQQCMVKVEVSTEAPIDLSFLYRTANNMPDDFSLLSE